jgi:hypothetical protein
MTPERLKILAEEFRVKLEQLQMLYYNSDGLTTVVDVRFLHRDLDYFSMISQAVGSHPGVAIGFTPLLERPLMKEGD